MVNFPLSHTAHTNRLFWRVDQNTLIGRFYLMHMICIRPEIDDFVIGSVVRLFLHSGDVSVGAVETLTDSDEYLVVEMQPREHERDFFGSAPLIRRARRDAFRMDHRAPPGDARAILVFHVKDVPASLPDPCARPIGSSRRSARD